MLLKFSVFSNLAKKMLSLLPLKAVPLEFLVALKTLISLKTLRLGHIPDYTDSLTDTYTETQDNATADRSDGVPTQLGCAGALQ